MPLLQLQGQNVGTPKKKNTEQFKQIVMPHISFLYNVALKYTGNTYSAEDIVQETMFIALEKLGQLKDESKCKSWLFSILRNVYYKELRHSKREQSADLSGSNEYLTILENIGEQTNVQAELEKKIDKAHIQQIIENLPEKFSSPMLLFFMENLSYQEISEALEIPLGTVMSRLSRAKSIFKKEMLRSIIIKGHDGNVIKMSDYKSSKAGS